MLARWIMDTQKRTGKDCMVFKMTFMLLMGKLTFSKVENITKMTMESQLTHHIQEKVATGGLYASSSRTI